MFPNTREELRRLVLNYSGMRGHALLISIYLVEVYSEHVGYSKFTTRALSQRTGLSTNTINKIVHDLETSREWYIDRKKGRANYYYPIIENLCKPQPKYKRVEKEQVSVPKLVKHVAVPATFMQKSPTFKAEGN